MQPWTVTTAQGATVEILSWPIWLPLPVLVLLMVGTLLWAWSPARTGPLWPILAGLLGGLLWLPAVFLPPILMEGSSAMATSHWGEILLWGGMQGVLALAFMLASGVVLGRRGRVSGGLLLGAGLVLNGLSVAHMTWLVSASTEPVFTLVDLPQVHLGETWPARALQSAPDWILQPAEPWTPTEAGTQDRVFEAHRPGMVARMAFPVRAGTRKGDPMFPLGPGHRWTWTVVEAGGRQTGIIVGKPRASGPTSTVSLELGEPEVIDGLERWPGTVISRTPEGEGFKEEERSLQLVAMDGELNALTVEGLLPFIAWTQDTPTSVGPGCFFGLFPGAGCGCGEDLEGTGIKPLGPLLCFRELDDGDGLGEAMGGLALRLITMGLVDLGNSERFVRYELESFEPGPGGVPAVVVRHPGAVDAAKEGSATEEEALEVASP